MKISAEVHPNGVRFKLTAESDYEHSMLNFLSSGAYEVSGTFSEPTAWRPQDPTICTLHLNRPQPESSPQSHSSK
jgi:hypothetical protein